MPEKFFDPNRFVDRELEHAIFEELLQLKVKTRILAIRDTSGMGKSQLLHKFQFRCRTAERSRIPVALIDLGQLSDSSPLVVVTHIARQLATFSLQFPNFERLDLARRDYDFTTIRSTVIRGTVDFGAANMQSAQITTAGVMSMFQKADSVTVNTSATVFDQEQQVMAQELCVRAFIEELRLHCQKKLIVILFDAYEKCSATLQDWLLDHFFGPLCFSKQPRSHKFVVVVAGHETPAFEQRWSQEECTSLIRSVYALGKWSASHVEQCLRVHGFQYQQPELKLFCDMVERNVPPFLVIQTMESILTRHN